MINNAIVYYLFIRPEIATKVFFRIREIKPLKLYLFSDGPRNVQEKQIILSNRDNIIKMIDWECDTKIYFLDDNIGIDQMWTYSFREVFNYEDQAIFLEEDIYPSKSFFYFCDELLDKYKEDQGVFMITGINALNEYPLEGNLSYFFLQSNSTWGFAFWKRSYELMTKDLSILYDSYYGPIIQEYFTKKNKSRFQYKRLVKYANKPELKIRFKNEISEIWFHDFNQYLLNNMLTIVPSKNLIQNLGNSNHSENSDSDILSTKRMKRSYSAISYDLTFPLLHPKFKFIDLIYIKKMVDLRKRNFISILTERIERAIRILIFGGSGYFYVKFRIYISRKISFLFYKRPKF